MSKRISEATKNNFKKLNKDLDNHSFVSRANKQDSTKNIIPLEYYSNKNNVQEISNIVSLISNIKIDEAISSLVVAYLIQNKCAQYNGKNIVAKSEYIQEFVDSLDYNKDYINIVFPNDERDPLGIIYQQLITEGEKNKKGSYYTPKTIVDELLKVDNDDKSTFCDPCCGTGGFLIEAQKRFNPSNVYGYDMDKNAIKIAKANLFIKYPNINYNERVKSEDFLYNKTSKFDYIITNPPWGNIERDKKIPPFSQITSGEMFSYFIEQSLKSLTPNGLINFLLPVSILNVLIHFDIRNIILNNYQIEEIRMFGKCFKGVLTDVISLKISNKKTIKNYKYTVITNAGKKYKCPVSVSLNNRNKNISLLDDIDYKIITKIEKKAKLDLNNAEFALGIITGDNKTKVKTKAGAGLRPIIIGKDINKYYLNSPSNYISYKRDEFQQVCDDKYFSTDCKFLYKFISKKLVFALDENKYLALNSANIMIPPKDYALSNYSLLAILNSNVMNFYFIKIINQIKVLKNDIQNLPLPNLTKDIQNRIDKLVKKEIKNKTNDLTNEIETIIYDFYGFTEIEKQRIESSITDII